MGSGLLEVRQSLPNVFMESEESCKLWEARLLHFHGQATVNQHWPWVLRAAWNPFHFTPGYNVSQVQCAFCYWILNLPWSISPAWEQALDHCPLPLISAPGRRSNPAQTTPKLMSAFHPPPRPDLASTYPQVMLLKRSNIRNGYHEGLPQRHLCTSESLH